MRVFYLTAHLDSLRRSDVLGRERPSVKIPKFGLAVLELGEINLVGLNDLASGVPYDGPSEKSAVYTSSTGLAKASAPRRRRWFTLRNLPRLASRWSARWTWTETSTRTFWPVPTTHGQRRLLIITLKKVEVRRTTSNWNRLTWRTRRVDCRTVRPPPAWVFIYFYFFIAVRNTIPEIIRTEVRLPEERLINTSRIGPLV